MKYVILILFMLSFWACEKDKVKGGDVVDVGVKIYYIQDGIDMLDTDNPSVFKLEDLRFEFQKNEGEIIPSTALTRGIPHIISEPEQGGTLLQLPVTNDNRLEPLPEQSAWVKVYWPNGIVDKFTFGIENPYENVEVASYIELNDKLVWPLTDEDKKGQRIVKIER